MRARFKLSNSIPVFPVAITFIAFFTAAIISGQIFQTRSSIAHVSAATNAAVVSVNAASFAGPLAPGAIAAAFGTNLATRLESAQVVPLPTMLAGTSVKVVDSRNVEFAAQLFFVSPGQINYLLPEQAALGSAQIVITAANGEVSRGELQLMNSSPAIFTASYTGRGLAGALSTFDGAV